MFSSHRSRQRFGIVGSTSPVASADASSATITSKAQRGRLRAIESRLTNVVAKWLNTSGLAERVDQAAVIPEWPRLVGPQIAAVTTPKSITANGTLFVEVRTNAWMNELSLLEPQLLKAINATEGRTAIRRIRWLLAP